MFGKYYQNELAYLREMGRAFGLANPSIAGMLSERGGDPDVERLLEGFAFLTARIRERIDEAVPEVVSGLTELLLPHYLRPLPACTIVEFTPQARALRGRTRLPRGTEVSAVPVEGTSCLFRTTMPVDLLPLGLVDAVLDQSSVQAPWIKLSFQTTEQGKHEVLQQDGIRLFLHGELSLSAALFLWLTRHCRKVELRDLSGSGKVVRLSPKGVRAVGFETDSALLPWPPRAPEGFRHLQEYFTLPQKFLFLDVTGLAGTAEAVGERFELAFEFERPPALPARLSRDNFRLHCAPVANLFAVGADPVRHELYGQEHLLRAGGVDPTHMEIYSVDRVVGLKSGRGERLEYRPFFDFAHGFAEGSQAFYRLKRALSPVNDGMDVFLSLGTPSEATPEPGEETLSIDLTCTNRSLPARLQIGDINVPTSASPTIAKFRNIVPVTRPLRPPLKDELHWRLLSHLALNQRSLKDVAVMRSLLDLYNFQTGADHPTARANHLRIEAVREVSMTPVRRFLTGASVRGNRTLIDLEEGRFSGLGDAFLFGCVLDEILAANVTLNAFNELWVRLQPSQLEFTWGPRSGAEPVL